MAFCSASTEDEGAGSRSVCTRCAVCSICKEECAHGFDCTTLSTGSGSTQISSYDKFVQHFMPKESRDKEIKKGTIVCRKCFEANTYVFRGLSFPKDPTLKPPPPPRTRGRTEDEEYVEGISPTLGKKQITKLHAHATTSCSHTPTHTHRLTGVDPKVGRPRHAEYNWRELKREVDFVRSKMTSIVANVHQSGKMEGDADKIADEVWDSFIAYSKNGIVEDARPGYFYGWMLMKGEMPALLNRGIPSSITPTTTTSTSKATQAEALHSLTAVLVRVTC